MNRIVQALLVVLIALAAINARGGGQESDAEKKLAPIQQLLIRTEIDTTSFPEEMPLSKFLEAVRRQLPGKKMIALRLEERELGKEGVRLANAPVRCSGLKVTLPTILRKTLRQVTKDVELDYAIREDGIVITRAPLAARSIVYSVEEIAHAMPSLRERLTGLAVFDADLFADVESAGGMALLARWLIHTVQLRPWEKIEILDGNRLAILASTDKQLCIVQMLDSLRRMSDVAVIMNARLYEVKRDFFRKQVAPLFAGKKDAEEHPAIIAIDGVLLNKIVQYKLIQESQERKLRPNEKRTFLSRHRVFRFVAAVKGEGVHMGMGQTGVSFEVRPLVSADRRYLRLHITQRVAQLVGIDKTKVLEPASGEDVEIEAPNVRKALATGTIQIPDTGAILMLVSYRPSGDDRVWLLVARPYIWIEEEEKERGPGGQITSKSIWKMEVPKEEETLPRAAPAGKPLVLDDDGQAILQAMLSDVLTNPDLADTRRFYGTPADKTVALVDGDKLTWPKAFSAKLHGYKAIAPVRSDPFHERRRVLGIRLDKFDLKERKSGPLAGPIEITLFNAGGSANGAVLGGCSVYYRPRRDGKRWSVECLGSLDP